MSTTQTEPVKSNVEQVDVNLDEIFNGAPSGDDIISQDSDKPKNIFSGLNDKADMSFADPDKDDKDDLNAKVEDKKDAENAEDVEELNVSKNEQTIEDKKVDNNADDILDTLDDNQESTNEETKTKKGRKPISGISDVFSKLIKEDKIVPFDDDKDLSEYSAKDWEELIQANLEEKARQIRNETPKQFFESLPEELQIAARYVAEGGQDMKGLFQTLAQTEETRSLNVKSERDQEKIILDYLTATGYGTTEEISEEIEMWKDLGKLEQQASKFKPKLDKMQEKVVAQKLEQQQLKRKQQEQASQTYMQNVYDTLKEGKVNDVKMGRKTQAML